jgi:uncharacterized protein (TIGR00730 family)
MNDTSSNKFSEDGLQKELSGSESWPQQTIRDTWRIFRIMAEFVDGFETLSRVGPCITLFGSARSHRGSADYELGREVAREATGRGYGVITGGGPGVMEAANRGAQEAGGVSVGLNIDLPFEQVANAFVDRDKLVNFSFFFVRKVMLLKYAQAVIVLPGGFGTLDELFESLTLIQTNKATPFPILMLGTDYWEGLLDWLRDKVLRDGKLSPEDMSLFTVTDDPAHALDIIEQFYEHRDLLKPKF